MDKETKKRVGVMAAEIRRNWPDKMSDALVERLMVRMVEFLTRGSEGSDSPLDVFLESKGKKAGFERRLLTLFGEVIGRNLLKFREVRTETVGSEVIPVAEFGTPGTALPDGYDELTVLVSVRMFSIMARMEGEIPYLNMRVWSVEGLAGGVDRVELVNNSACSGKLVTEFKRNDVGEVVGVKQVMEATLKRDGKKRIFENTFIKIGEISLGDGGMMDGVWGMNQIKYAVFCQENPEWELGQEEEVAVVNQVGDPQVP